MSTFDIKPGMVIKRMKTGELVYVLKRYPEYGELSHYEACPINKPVDLSYDPSTIYFIQPKNVQKANSYDK